MRRQEQASIAGAWGRIFIGYGYLGLAVIGLTLAPVLGGLIRHGLSLRVIGVVVGGTAAAGLIISYKAVFSRRHPSRWWWVPAAIGLAVLVTPFAFGIEVCPRGGGPCQQVSTEHFNPDLGRWSAGTTLAVVVAVPVISWRIRERRRRMEDLS